MRIAASLLLCLGLVACTHVPVAVRSPEPLFHDALFAAPTEPVTADDVFALSDEMKRYVRDEIYRQVMTKGRQRALVDALYQRQRQQLLLEYDTAMTRNAAQAFAARSGNCLSLVIMTAAFAKELGLPLEYQSAFLEETWSRNGDLVLRSGHVNLTLGPRLVDLRGSVDTRSITIDFLPPEEALHLRTRAIDERTVVAMYMNNRAAEALVQGRLDDAYAWAREAIRTSPDFMSAYNTLGVVYLRHRDLAEAEQALRRLLDQEPGNTRAMYNLASVLDRAGRVAEAGALRQQLTRIEPDPPFRFFSLGMAAMDRGDYRAARDWFAKEVARADYYHEFHYWLGVASYKLGDIQAARTHLARAMEMSPSRRDSDQYAAKLAWLRSQQQQAH